MTYFQANFPALYEAEWYRKFVNCQITPKENQVIIIPERKVGYTYIYLNWTSQEVHCLHQYVQWNVSRDHCHERSITSDHTFLGPIFQYIWACHHRPSVATDHNFVVCGVVIQYRFYCINTYRESCMDAGCFQSVILPEWELPVGFELHLCLDILSHCLAWTFVPLLMLLWWISKLYSIYLQATGQTIKLAIFFISRGTKWCTNIVLYTKILPGA